MALDHSETEQAVRYDVDVTYPGAATERTMRRFTFFTSDGHTAACDE
ncbi:MAG: hypothetical protein ACRDYF_03595 [Acidimicrobiia bacterium]